MRFKVGDAVVHPVRGAGVIAGFHTFEMQGSTQQYYNIKLLRKVETNLMLPVTDAESTGLRPAVPPSKLDKVWQVLKAPPESLPSNHRARYKVLEDKMQGGDIFELAEVVRDMTWKQRTEGFTTKGKRYYAKSVRLLAGEFAVSLDIELATAEEQIRTKMEEILPPAETG